MASELNSTENDRRQDDRQNDRRQAVSWLSRIGMAVGLVAAYGTLAAFMGRFLYPAKSATKGWMFVTSAKKLQVGGALLYRTPSGATVNIAKSGDGGDADSFIALSSVCPHLGCQVQWQAQNDQFFCPCHNGTFAPDGKATGGPPGEAGQSLPTYPLKIADGLLYIEVPVSDIARGPGEIIEINSPVGAGHDPCLCSSRRA